MGLSKRRNWGAEELRLSSFPYALPNIDRIQLFDLVCRAQEKEPLNHDLIIIARKIADTFCLADQETATSGLVMTLGKETLREKRDTQPEDTSEKYDDYTTNEEQSAIAWLSRSLATDLLKALGYVPSRLLRAVFNKGRARRFLGFKHHTSAKHGSYEPTRR